MLAEKGAHEADHLVLRSVPRLVPRDEVPQPVVLHVAARFRHHAEEVRGHQQELTHRHDVEHLRMHGDEHGGRGAQGTHREEAELRRAVENDEVVVGFDFGQFLRDAREEHLTRTSREHSRRVMLELHQIEVARDQVEVGEVRLPDDLSHRLGVFVPNGVVERPAVEQIELGLETMEGGERRLRVEVDREDAVAIERALLGEVRGGCGFARAAFEVDDGDDLEVIIFAAAGQVGARRFGARFQHPTQGHDVVRGVQSASPGARFGLWPSSFETEFAQVGIFDAQELGDFSACESAQLLGGVRREQLCSMGQESFGEFCRVLTDESIDSGTLIHRLPLPKRVLRTLAIFSPASVCTGFWMRASEFDRG